MSNNSIALMIILGLTTSTLFEFVVKPAVKQSFNPDQGI